MRPPRETGFTLVEVMVALLAFALMAAAGVALLSAAVATRDSVSASAKALADLQRARTLMAADIGQAAARRVREADGRPEPQAFAPDAEGALLRLTRTGWINPAGEARASLQLVEYRVVEGRLERRFFGRLDGARPAPVQVLLTGVRDARVTFLSQGAETAAWAPTPDRPLPDAVRVTLTLPRYGVVSQLFLAGA